MSLPAKIVKGLCAFSRSYSGTPHYRPALFALYAFNLEASRRPDVPKQIAG